MMRAFAAVIAGLLLNMAALGDSIPAYYRADVTENGSSLVSSGSTTVSETLGGPLSIPGEAGNGLAQAIAGPNLLGVYGETSGDDFAQADALLVDQLQLANAPTSGILAVYVRVNGSTTVLTYGIANPQTAVTLSVDISSAASCVQLIAPLHGGDQDGCGQLSEGANLFKLPYKGASVLGFQ
jgi:hypothetical protein